MGSFIRWADGKVGNGAEIYEIIQLSG